MWDHFEARKLSIAKYKGINLTTGIEGSVILMADIEGDWREELITILPGEMRIYRTTIPATDRRVTLLQDPFYRSHPSGSIVPRGSSRKGLARRGARLPV